MASLARFCRAISISFGSEVGIGSGVGGGFGGLGVPKMLISISSAMPSRSSPIPRDGQTVRQSSVGLRQSQGRLLQHSEAGRTGARLLTGRPETPAASNPELAPSRFLAWQIVPAHLAMRRGVSPNEMGGLNPAASNSLFTSKEHRANREATVVSTGSLLLACSS